jgi:hypothetical protein
MGGRILNLELQVGGRRVVGTAGAPPGVIPDLYPRLRLTRGAEVGIVALSLGERVARVRRSHQPARVG